MHSSPREFLSAMYVCDCSIYDTYQEQNRRKKGEVHQNESLHQEINQIVIEQKELSKQELVAVVTKSEDR